MGREVHPGEPAENDIGMLLRAWSGGDQAALEKLTPMVYFMMSFVALLPAT
jgi:hypothetical protein